MKILLVLLFLLVACSHATVMKNCDPTISGAHAVCDSLWFWE